MILLWVGWLDQTISRGPFQHQLFCDSVKAVFCYQAAAPDSLRQFQSNSSRQSATNILTSSPLHTLLLAETSRTHTACCLPTGIVQKVREERALQGRTSWSRALVAGSKLFALFVTSTLVYVTWFWRFPNAYKWVYFDFPWLTSYCPLHTTADQWQDKAIQTLIRKKEACYYITRTNMSSSLNNMSIPLNILQNIYSFPKFNINFSTSLGGRKYQKNRRKYHGI